MTVPYEILRGASINAVTVVPDGIVCELLMVHVPVPPVNVHPESVTVPEMSPPVMAMPLAMVPVRTLAMIKFVEEPEVLAVMVTAATVLYIVQCPASLMIVGEHFRSW